MRAKLDINIRGGEVHFECNLHTKSPLLTVLDSHQSHYSQTQSMVGREKKEISKHEC